MWRYRNRIRRKPNLKKIIDSCENNKAIRIKFLNSTQTKLIHLLNIFVLYQMNLFYHNVE